MAAVAVARAWDLEEGRRGLGTSCGFVACTLWCNDGAAHSALVARLLLPPGGALATGALAAGHTHTGAPRLSPITPVLLAAWASGMTNPPHPTPPHLDPIPPRRAPPSHPAPYPIPAARFEPENAKMWFRKGKALSLKGDYEEAAAVLKQ